MCPGGIQVRTISLYCCMKESKVDILLDQADFAFYCDFCLIFRILQWSVF
nr:MAG TPA: hypothetical protein [Caudoviricetes sp.]